MSKQVTVSYGQPAPNKMFAPELTTLLRFVTYSEKIACAYCGKLKKKHWTLLSPFKIADMKGMQFSLQPSERTLGSGESVCTDHLLLPAIRKEMLAGYGEAVPFPEPKEADDDGSQDAKAGESSEAAQANADESGNDADQRERTPNEAAQQGDGASSEDG